MIDQDTLELLDHRDAETRKRAVISLGKSNDYTALAHLARIYREDPDPDVRDMARKAGVYLRKNTTPPENPIDNMKLTAQVTSEVAAVPLMKNHPPVSVVDADKARGYLRQALDWNVRGDDDRAVAMLARAFSADPRLSSDPVASGLAASLTNLPADQACHMLVTMPGAISKRAGRKRGFAQDVPAGDRAVIVGLGMLGAMLIVTLFMPWLDFSEFLPGFSFSGYDFIKGLSSVESDMLNLSPLMRGIWLVPLAGAIMICLSGFMLATGFTPEGWTWQLSIGCGVMAAAGYGMWYWALTGSPFVADAIVDFLGLGFFAGLVSAVALAGAGVYGVSSR
jgi:hypothetical protein